MTVKYIVFLIINASWYIQQDTLTIFQDSRIMKLHIKMYLSPT